MKGDQIGTLTAHPSLQELSLSNWTWFNLVHERLLEWALTPPLWHAEAVGGRPHHQALQARGTDLDLIRELPSGPAACEPHQRPHTCQHPTTGHTAPEDFSCSSRGVHTCRKRRRFSDERARLPRACCTS